MSGDFAWVLLLLLGVVVFSMWWVVKSFDTTEGLRRWAEEMRDREDEERD